MTIRLTKPSRAWMTRCLALHALPLWLAACGSSESGGDVTGPGATAAPSNPAAPNSNINPTPGSNGAEPAAPTNVGSTTPAAGSMEMPAGNLPIDMEADSDGAGAANSGGGNAPGDGDDESAGGEPDGSSEPPAGQPPANGECDLSGISPDEVVWSGDSWIDIPGTQKARVNELAREAGVLGANESFVDLAVSGSPINTIINQYNNRQAGATPVRVLLMDGGGIDTIRGGGSPASVTDVVDAFTEHLAKVASDGTVEQIVYFLYPELPAIAGVAALRPGMQAACAASAVPCHFLDLQPLWEGHPEYNNPNDPLHPSEAGGNAIAENIWAIMQENCIAQ